MEFGRDDLWVEFAQDYDGLWFDDSFDSVLTPTWVSGSTSEADELLSGTDQVKQQDKRDEEEGGEGDSASASSSVNNRESQQDVKKERDAAKRKRDEKNSQKCKRFRERRKRQMAELRTRNEEIEQEKELLLSKISELQTELSALRGGGSTNLELENELLRREIRQHKIFVHNIVRATKSAPLSTPEERYRLLYSGLRAGVGQVTGLAYTSAIDPEWRHGKSFMLDKFECRFKYQYMPWGVEPSKAKRINLRLEVIGAPIPPDALGKAVYKVKADTEYINEHLKNCIVDDCTRLAENISESQLGQVQLDEVVGKTEMQVIRVRGYGSDEVKEMICVVANEETEVFPHAMIGETEPGIDYTPCKANILVQTSSVTKTLPVFENPEGGSAGNIVRVTAPLLQSQVCFPEPSNPSLTRVIFVHSYPLCDRAFRDLLGETFPIVRDDALDDKYLESMKYHYQALVKPILPPSYRSSS